MTTTSLEWAVQQPNGRLAVIPGTPGNWTPDRAAADKVLGSVRGGLELSGASNQVVKLLKRVVTTEAGEPEVEAEVVVQ